MDCLTYAIPQNYKLPQLFAFLQTEEKNVKRIGDIIFYKKKKQFVYVFAFGAIVFWGFDSKSSLSFIKSIETYADEIPSSFEMADFSYEVGKKTKINAQDDSITLENDTDEFYKLAISYALAQSIKLVVHEKELKLTLDKMKTVPKSLAHTGRTTLKNNEISKMIGKLYLQKWTINSQLNFMHTPRIIWDRSEIEPYYIMASEFLDLHTRVESLNMGLTMVQDLMEILQDQLNNKHSAIMEWAIVLLICVEIILFIAKDLIRL